MKVLCKCPHCKKESTLEANEASEKIDNYAITCPHCKKPFMKELPGEPSAVVPVTEEKADTPE